MMSIPERSLFLRRSGAGFEHQQRWARSLHQGLPYGLYELRELAERRLHEGRCPYCRGQLSAANFCFDHRLPIVRDGRFTLRNLEVCCAACQRAKGVLDATEYRELLAVVAAWPKPVAANFLDRLRAGASTVGGRLPRVGSLEWFTGPLITEEEPDQRRDVP